MGEHRKFWKAINSKLHMKILKKMEYLDFASFNQCSKESAEICKRFPDNFRLNLKVQRINIDKYGNAMVAVYSEKGREVFVPKFPRVRFTAEWMVLKAKHSKFLKRHSVKTKFVRAYLEPDSFTDDDAEFVKFLLQTTQATKIKMNCSSEKVLALPEVCNLQVLKTRGSLPLSDQAFLKLLAHTLKMKHLYNKQCATVTVNGVFEFIKQWVEGKREIRKFQLYFEHPLNLRCICDALNERTQAVASFEEKERLLIRRSSEGTADALFITAFGWNIKFLGADWMSVDTFPLPCVPLALYSTIVEKMPYKQFDRFSRCSPLAKEITRTLPRQVKLEYKADSILIDIDDCWIIDRSMYGVDDDYPGFDISYETRKIHFTVYCITMEDAHMGFFDQHSIKAKLFETQDAFLTDEDVEMFQRILRETGVTQIHIDCRSEQIMYLPELQKIEDIRAYFMYFNDTILLSLRAHDIMLTRCDDEPMFHNITLNGIFLFLEQWLNKKREIQYVLLPFVENLNLEVLMETLEKFPAFKVRKHKTGFWLCRDNEAHCDCLFIKVDKDGDLRMIAGNVTDGYCRFRKKYE